MKKRCYNKNLSLKKNRKLQLNKLKLEVYKLCDKRTLKLIYYQGYGKEKLGGKQGDYYKIHQKYIDDELIQRIFCPKFKEKKLDFRMNILNILMLHLKSITIQKIKTFCNYDVLFKNNEERVEFNHLKKSDVLHWVLSKILMIKNPILSKLNRKIEIEQQKLDSYLSPSGLYMLDKELFIHKDLIFVIFSFFDYTTKLKQLMDNIGTLNSDFYLILLESIGINKKIYINYNNLYKIPLVILQNLRYVEFDTFRLDDYNIKYVLDKLKNLRKLFISNFKRSNGLFEIIKKNPGFKFEFLKTIRIYKDDTLKFLTIDQFPKLNKIIFTKISTYDKCEIIEQIKTLKFQLSNSKFRVCHLVGVSIKDCFQPQIFINVKSISIKGISNINWSGIDKFSKLKRLKFIIEIYEDLKRLIELPNLENLQLDIFYDNIEWFNDNMKRLEFGDVVDYVCKKFPGLKDARFKLFAKFCFVSKNDCYELGKRLKGLKFLTFELYKHDMLKHFYGLKMTKIRNNGLFTLKIEHNDIKGNKEEFLKSIEIGQRHKLIVKKKY